MIKAAYNFIVGWAAVVLDFVLVILIAGFVHFVLIFGPLMIADFYSDAHWLLLYLVTIPLLIYIHEWLLRMVMRENHCKVWDGEDWVDAED